MQQNTNAIASTSQKSHPLAGQYLYLFGVNPENSDGTGADGVSIDKAPNFIGLSQSAESDLATRNGADGSVFKDTARYAGRWSMCLKIFIPDNRRINCNTLSHFWRNGWRTLFRRVFSGIRLAIALRLEWWLDDDWRILFTPHEEYTMSKAMRTEVTSLIQHIGEKFLAPSFDANDALAIDTLNTIDNERHVFLFHKKEMRSICFTIGATLELVPLSHASITSILTDGGIARRLPDRSTLPVVPTDPDWDALASNLLAYSTAPTPTSAASIGIKSQVAGGENLQAMGLELMTMATNPTVVERANTIIQSLKEKSPPGSVLSRVGVGRAPFQQLAVNVGYICRGEDGELDNDLLAQAGPHCYNDITEFRTHPYTRVPIHKHNICVCGAKNSLTRLVRVRLVGRSKSQRPRSAYQCISCGRTTRTSFMYYTDIGALRTRIGEPLLGNETESVLKVADDLFADVDNIAPLKRIADSQPTRQYVEGMGEQLDKVLGIT